MIEDALRLDGVTKRFGHGRVAVDALWDVSMSVAPREFVAVMGPSGSGKSTLLALAGGLETPTNGKVFVDGTDLHRLSQGQLARLRRRRIGFVFQQYNLIPSLTAIENVALPLELDGVSKSGARERAKQSLGVMGLTELSVRFPDELSGGEQQRVAIARAAVSARGLLLADEPTGALDTVTGESVLRLLRHHCDRGGSAVLVTHDARFAAWADRVVFLRDGRIFDQTHALEGPESLLRPAKPG